MTDTEKLNRAALTMAAAIVAACEATPNGTPGGTLYAALMAQGCTLPQFERVMGALVGAGVLQKRGECYRITGAGESFLRSQPCTVPA